MALHLGSYSQYSSALLMCHETLLLEWYFTYLIVKVLVTSVMF